MRALMDLIRVVCETFQDMFRGGGNLPLLWSMRQAMDVDE